MCVRLLTRVIYELAIILPIVDSHTHEDYTKALMHQMGLQTGKKIRDKLDNNNAVEESSRVHTGHQHLDQQLLLQTCKLSNQRHVCLLPKFCMHTVSAVIVKCSPLTTYVENDLYVTLLSFCVMLFVISSSKSSVIVSVCPVNVCVRCTMFID